MNKILSTVVVMFLFVIVFSCGCTEKNNGDDTGPKTVNMNAQEFIDDFSFSTSISGGNMKWTSDYKSLNEGDTLIFTDKIYNITYMSFFMYNATTVYFDVENYTKMGVNASEVAFLFEGNITDEFSIGDDVRITLTVKHFVYTNETSGASIDMEVFEEGWDQDSFMMHFFTQVLPKNCIEKI